MSKESRRQAIEKEHEVILLVGDTLADFTDKSDGVSREDRDKEVEELKDQYGERFVMLPNPLYGDWEFVLYDYEHMMPDEGRNDVRKEFLDVYVPDAE